MKVKSINLLIILTLIFQLILPVLVPLVSYAEETQNRWDISEKGDGSVIAVLDSAGILTISGKGNMKNWNSSNVSWYSKRKNIKSVKIENGVTSIGNFAFYMCSSLTSIEIPSSITSIDISGFRFCSSFTNIDVDENSQSYLSENGVLFNKEKTKLICYPAGKVETTYSIPTSVTSIGVGAFFGCSNLTNINIPNSVTSIEDNAFENCRSFTSIEIPSSVTSIGAYAFEYCRGLTSINIPSSVTSIGDGAFRYCSSLTSIEIPSSVTSIGRGVFRYCSSLISIEIPSSVISIGNEAFESCISLTNIHVDENSQSYLSENGILFNKEKTELICYPAGKVETTYSIPSSVTMIANFAFSYCSSLTSINIPSGVTNIWHYVFEACSSLTSINIPSSVTSIGNGAFKNCSNLTSIEIPSGVTSIGYGAFENCRSLTSIEIPNSVKSIGDDAFHKCSNVKIYTNSDYVVSYAKENSLNHVIDKNLPTVTSVTVNPNTWTKGNVTVTINGAKDAVVGLAKKPYSFDGGVTWQAENTKTYTENTQGIQIQVRDSLGNVYKHKKINAQIDKTSPKITGVEEGKTYEVALTVTITDNSLKTVELTKDGVKVEGFKSGDTIRESGKYKLTATDEAGNISVVNFTMDIVLHVNTKYATEAIDGKYYITKVNPGTTIETFKNNISTNGTIKIYKGTTEITDTSKKISTGMTMKVQLGNKEVIYEIIVTGDLNGDGEMNDIDLLRLVRYKSGLDKTLTGSYLKASDICKDGTPSEDRDLLKMARVLVGLDKI